MTLKQGRLEATAAGFSARARLRAPLLGLLLLAAGLALQWASARSPEIVERRFARGVYPVVAGGLGRVAALVPISIAECALVALGVWLAAGLGRLAFARDRRRRIGRAGARALLGAGALYAAFLLLWGLNYQRQPFATIAGLPVRPSGVDELATLCGALVQEANAAREGLPEDEAGAMRLAGGPREALARTEAGFRAAAARHPVLAGPAARPKPLLASAALSWLGITGIYSPFTAEPNVNLTLPDPALPFSAAHEVAHQRGFAREDEANYLGYLACRLHPDPDFRYSGRLAASVYALNALASRDRAAWERIEAARSPGVRRDLAALLAWAERYRGPAERVSRRVNDAYLRSQGQDQGVTSYGRVVDLLLAERRAAGEPAAE